MASSLEVQTFPMQTVQAGNDLMNPNFLFQELVESLQMELQTKNTQIETITRQFENVVQENKSINLKYDKVYENLRNLALKEKVYLDRIKNLQEKVSEKQKQGESVEEAQDEKNDELIGKNKEKEQEIKNIQIYYEGRLSQLKQEIEKLSIENKKLNLIIEKSQFQFTQSHTIEDTDQSQSNELLKRPNDDRLNTGKKGKIETIQPKNKQELNQLISVYIGNQSNPTMRGKIIHYEVYKYLSEQKHCLPQGIRRLVDNCICQALSKVRKGVMLVQHIVQGSVIDCVIYGTDYYVIIDWKTGQIYPDDFKLQGRKYASKYHNRQRRGQVWFPMLDLETILKYRGSQLLGLQQRQPNRLVLRQYQKEVLQNFGREICTYKKYKNDKIKWNQVFRRDQDYIYFLKGINETLQNTHQIKRFKKFYQYKKML